MPLSSLSSAPGVLPVVQTQRYLTYRICDRAVGKGSLPLHAQGLCSSYSSLTCFYKWPISGQEKLSCSFLKGSRRLNPPCPVTVPTWDLPTVLRALKSPPFEPLQSVDLRPLTVKTALLLALASVKRMGDLQVLSVSPSCLEFGPNDSKIVLRSQSKDCPDG